MKRSLKKPCLTLLLFFGCTLLAACLLFQHSMSRAGDNIRALVIYGTDCLNHITSKLPAPEDPNRTGK